MLDARAPWRRRPSCNARHVPVARMHVRRACAGHGRAPAGIGAVRMTRRAACAVRCGADARAQMVHDGAAASKRRETGGRKEKRARCAPVRRIGAAGGGVPGGAAAHDAPREGSISSAARTDRRRATTRRSRLAGCTAS
ncbi:hypothetical protein DF141_19035 [Burkholderia cenocepacia]|nr:hypothetical protein DF141_19035 [Burkholderia cenocepacia]RQZ93757.1 hypothetical protein DF058_18150 [Burkholderia cenocepacia]RRA14534.1 hypothetical protein DF059_18300 [Burkholderia cenocepacia]